MPPQPPTGPNPREAGSRIRSSARLSRLEDFSARLDTTQVEGELNEIFRESPEFGRALSQRLERFIDQSSEGSLELIGAGGEATVFADDARQQVIKLSGPPARSQFGWIIYRESDGLLSLKPGDLASVLARLALFEALFPTGLSIDAIADDGSFFLFRQIFIAGTHPTEEALHTWMTGHGWTRSFDSAHGKTLSTLTWTKGKFIATDVRPENVIQADSNGELYPIDFIVSGDIPG